MDERQVKEALKDAFHLAEEHPTPSVAQLIQDSAHHPLIFYGAGAQGKSFYRFFKQHGAHVRAFIDRQATMGDKFDGTDVFNNKALPNAFTKTERQNCIVFLSFYADRAEYASIKQQLSESGFVHIVDFFVLCSQFLTITNLSAGTIETDFYQKNTELILKAAHLFDGGDADFFINRLTAFITRNASLLPAIANGAQYFPKDIPFSKGYKRFIDCGAYNGDTARDLFIHQNDVERLALFEPDEKNFHVLSQYIQMINQDYTVCETILFPCGVYSKSSFFRFSNLGNTNSLISQNGESTIQCVPIDAVLSGFAPTFIKMDIEGSEYDALLGAEQTIRRYRPDLAISIYHYRHDLWRLPLLLDSWKLGYHFFLRSHNICDIDTVLYATTEEGRLS